MKKFKSAFTLFIAMTIVVSMLTSSVFAATSYDGSTDPEKTGVAIETNGIGGKDASDSYYSVDSACTSREKSFTLPNFANTLECQFMLSSETAALQVRMIMHGTEAKASSGNHSYTYLEVNGDTMGFYHKNGSSAAWGAKWEEDVNLVPGRWYTLVAKFGDLSASDGQQEAEYYLNGELIHSGSELTNLYGIRNWSFGPKEEGNTVYVDNITVSNGRGVNASDPLTIDTARHTPSEPTSFADGIGFGINENTLIALPSLTVAEFKNGITTTDGTDDIIKVYKEDLVTLADDNDAAIGNVLVIASKNGEDTEQAYNYYKISELDYDEEFGRGKNASDIQLEEGTTIESVPGNFGKLASDEVYKFVKTSGSGIHLARTFKDGALTLGTSYGHLEFAFLLSEGTRLTSSLQYFIDGSHAYIPLNIEIGRLTSGSGSDPKQLCTTNVEANKWHTFGITIPTDGAEDGVAKIYIDGVYATDVGAQGAKGFRQPFLGFDGTSADAPIYIDNISMLPVNEYENAAYAPSAVTSADDDITIDEAAGKIVAPFGSSVGDVYNSLTAPNVDDTIRIYNADYTLSENTDDTNNKIVVVASKNGTKVEQALNYYALSEFDLDDGKCCGKKVSDLALLEGTTAQSVAGNFGKLTTDEVYKLNKTSGDGISLANTFVGANLFSGGKHGRIDFDFAIDSGAMASVRVAYFTEGGHSSQQINFAVGKTTSGSSLTADEYPADIKANTWYSVTITCPTATNDNDNRIKIYLNGKLLRELGAEGALGMRRPFLIPNYTSGGNSVYLDNILVSEGNSNEVAYDVPVRLDVNKGVAYNNAISYIETPDASDFSTEDANTVIRFYDADWEQVNTVDAASYVVTASVDTKGMEYVWEYYTIDSQAKDYVAALYYYDGKYLARAYSKDNNSRLFLASYEHIYEDSKRAGTYLKGIKVADEHENGKLEITGDVENYSYSTYLWDLEGAPLTGIKGLEYKK